MPNVVVPLTIETEQRLRRQAIQRGESLEVFLGQLAEKQANADAEDELGKGVEWLTRRSPQDVCSARDRILGASPPAREIPAGKNILDMVEGKWPGSETDLKIQDALTRLS